MDCKPSTARFASDYWNCRGNAGPFFNRNAGNSVNSGCLIRFDSCAHAGRGLTEHAYLIVIEPQVDQPVDTLPIAQSRHTRRDGLVM